MIVVIGLPAYAGSAGGRRVGGLAVDVAAAAAVLGSSVELVGKVGDDGAGDAVVLALGRLGVGHAALLRDPARPRRCCPPWQSPRSPKPRTGPPTRWRAPLSRQTRWRRSRRRRTAGRGRAAPADPAARPGLEAGDISLALRYLAEARVVVLAEPLPEVAVAAVVEGATFAGARLVVLLRPAPHPRPCRRRSRFSRPPPSTTDRSVAWWAPSPPGSMPGRSQPRRSRRRSGLRAGSLSRLRIHACAAPASAARRALRSCRVPAMDRASEGSVSRARPPFRRTSTRLPGPAGSTTAIALIRRADELMEAGEPEHALALYGRTLGASDRDVSAAALYGMVTHSTVWTARPTPWLRGNK